MSSGLMVLQAWLGKYRPKVRVVASPFGEKMLGITIDSMSMNAYWSWLTVAVLLDVEHCTS